MAISSSANSGERFPFIESSGERGDLIMLPKKIGPFGGVSREVARKYVFDIFPRDVKDCKQVSYYGSLMLTTR